MEIASVLRSAGIEARDFHGREDNLCSAVAQELSEGRVVGWFQGRMEFGPRALGGRSILADPRHPEMRGRINALVKNREPFRPFAPAVLEKRAAEHFDIDHPSRFMTETCQVISPIALPSVTHIDGSARVQTVTESSSPHLARLLTAFDRLTGCPILLNTSFNLQGEPIVCTPVDALISFMRSDIDLLVLGSSVIHRAALSPAAEQIFRSTIRFDESAVQHRTYTLF
jgi:carbamoyltransferase